MHPVIRGEDRRGGQKDGEDRHVSTEVSVTGSILLPIPIYLHLSTLYTCTCLGSISRHRAVSKGRPQLTEGHIGDCVKDLNLQIVFYLKCPEPTW